MFSLTASHVTVAIVVVITVCGSQTIAKTTCTRSFWEETIERDLDVFNGGITQQHLAAGEELVHGWRFIILNNTLYYKPIKNGPGVAHAMVLLLVRAMCRYPMPDVEFIMHAGDYKDSVKRWPNLYIVFSNTKDIIYDMDLLIPYQSFFHLNHAVKGFEHAPVDWQEKRDQAVWRGSTTNGLFTEHNWMFKPRSKLAMLCQNNTGYCDGGYVAMNVQAFKEATHAMQQQLQLSPRISMHDMARYKYIVSMDGNTAPTARSAVLMFSGSAVLRQESPYTEFWYQSLVPYHNYIPLSYDSSDIVQKVEWARWHDGEVKRIASNALALAHEQLHDDAVACYWHRLLTQYAARQKFKPVLSAEFKQVLYNASANQEVQYLAETEAGRCNFSTQWLID